MRIVGSIFLTIAICSAQEIVFEGEDPPEIFCPGTNEPCKAPSQCPLTTALGEDSEPRLCVLSDGNTGVCCPPSFLIDRPVPTELGETLHLRENKQNLPPLPSVNDNDLELAVRVAPQRVMKVQDSEDFLLSKANEVLDAESGTFSVVSLRQTSSFAHFSLFGGEKDTLSLAFDALQVAEASRQLKQSLNLNPQAAGVGLSRFSIRNTNLRSSCPQQPSCNLQRKYRSIDGTCNNLRDPLMGKSKTAFNRILDAQYSDGIWAERVARDGSKLPSTRQVSQRIISDAESPRPELSIAIAHWGQFIDHDITLTPTFTLRNGSGIECCSSNGFLLPNQFLHPQCLPIEIPRNDRFYAQFRRTCMSFVRSLIAPRPDCNFGYSEQMNENTHWIDGSMIYGGTAEQARSVRAFQGGRLKTSFQRTGGRSLLPQQSQNARDCASDVCYVAGDKRVNEQAMLATLHTIFLREHNRIAATLGQLNPRWNDEQLFQETRRIVVAEIQHITYNEWLPNIIGRKFMETYGLYPKRNGYFQGYDQNIDARMTNEFSTAAFRFGHSLLPNFISVIDPFGRADQSSQLSRFFDEGGKLTNPSYLDSVIRGMLVSPSQNFDNAFTPEVTNKLFSGLLPHGMDLVSLNTQRGRDHGLPGYNHYRSVCSLPTARSFEDLIGTMPAATVQALRNVYRHVDDIDLFIGGICEIAAPGSLLGPTFTCLVGDQFARLRLGDRFFYDIGQQVHSFSPSQLREIQKVSLARILCDNSDGTLQTIQPLVFRLPNGLNQKTLCGSLSIPRVDLRFWAGEPVQ